MMWVHSTQSTHGSIWAWPQWKLQKEQTLKTVQLFFTQPNKEKIFLRRRGKKSKDKSSALNEKRLSSPIWTFKRRSLVKTENQYLLVNFVIFGGCHLCRLESNTAIIYYLLQCFLYDFSDCCWQLSPIPTEVIGNFYNSLKSISY